PPAEDEECHRTAERLRLRANYFVEQQVAPANRRGKEKGDLRLAELQAAGVRRQRPGQDHDDQDDHADDVDDEIARRRDHAHPRVARVLEEHEPEVREAGDGADEIAWIAQPAQALSDAIARGAQRELDERPDHALAFSSEVMRRNASSSETS